MCDSNEKSSLAKWLNFGESATKIVLKSVVLIFLDNRINFIIIKGATIEEDEKSSKIEKVKHKALKAGQSHQSLCKSEISIVLRTPAATDKHIELKRVILINRH